MEASQVYHCITVASLGPQPLEVSKNKPNFQLISLAAPDLWSLTMANNTFQLDVK